MTFRPIAGGRSGTPPGAVNLALDRTERVQRWVAALLTVLLHVLFLLFLMSPPEPITMTAPQGQAAGSTTSAMEVTLLDEPISQTPPPPVPVPRKPATPKKPKTPRAIAPRPPTPVVQLAETPDTPTVLPITEPEPSDAPDDTAERPFGPPPGFRSNENARASEALAAKLGRNRGRSNEVAPVGINMGVDGFQVYYDLADEDLLRAWRNQGMTELFLPMPGTLRRMVCPLEVALRRGSGECRMVEMDSPELQHIGDAREVINIQQVYRLGKQVWSGPGAYR